MADNSSSPSSRHHRLLTRTDSIRLVASRGAIGFAYGFMFASILFMLFLVHSFHSSRRYHFSKVFAHIFNNNPSFSPPPYNNNTNIESTRHQNSQVEDEISLRTSSSSSNSTSQYSSSQISRKEGSGLTKKHSNQESGDGLHINPPINNIIQVKPQESFPPNAMEFRNNCDMFEGSWVKDDSYPLYKSGSCPHIDEPFNCFLNGRSDNMYEKYRWQPKNCNIPRLKGNDMLEILRGKRLVFVGDSLNRNMWESLVCILSNSVENKSNIFEASGRQEFRTEDSYSFIFTDYNCSIEFFRSPFLVQEWEVPGSKKETLRLDLVERSCDKYKNADVLIFNTGHWWTHEKRTIGKEYYQEGNHIHGQLNVEDAFYKALLTWSQWVDANVDPNKSIVFFRGYSPSHFSGGEWNSGGQCDNETQPMRNESELSENPPMMKTIESVIKRMKNPVFYLNITKMTDFRHDAHPSMYRNMNMSDETKRFMLTHQDCSHWCLPGVPDLWNELVYAHLLYINKRNRGNPQT